jgi:hypothetical protein
MALGPGLDTLFSTWNGGVSISPEYLQFASELYEMNDQMSELHIPKCL